MFNLVKNGKVLAKSDDVYILIDFLHSESEGVQALDEGTENYNTDLWLTDGFDNWFGIGYNLTENKLNEFLEKVNSPMRVKDEVYF